MHAFYREAGVSALQRAQFTPEHLPEMVMSPRDAAEQLVRNNVDYLPIDEIEGRIATTLFVVYPPGIATIVPGERLDARARPMIDYLKMFERAANLFPGFEAEIQGLYREPQPDGQNPVLHLCRARGRRRLNSTRLLIRQPQRARVWRRRLCSASTASALARGRPRCRR